MDATRTTWRSRSKNQPHQDGRSAGTTTRDQGICRLVSSIKSEPQSVPDHQDRGLRPRSPGRRWTRTPWFLMESPRRLRSHPPLCRPSSPPHDSDRRRRANPGGEGATCRTPSRRRSPPPSLDAVGYRHVVLGKHRPGVRHDPCLERFVFSARGEHSGQGVLLLGHRSSQVKGESAGFGGL